MKGTVHSKPKEDSKQSPAMWPRHHLRNDNGCHLVGDDGLGLAAVDVDCLKGVNAQ